MAILRQQPCGGLRLTPQIASGLILRIPPFSEVKKESPLKLIVLTMFCVVSVARVLAQHSSPDDYVMLL